MALSNAQPKDLALHVLEKLQHSKLSLDIPPLGVLEDLFECLFFTSMRTEESDLVKVTITLIDPDNPDPRPPRRIVAERWSCIKFDVPLEMTIKALVKLSKASDPSSTSLAVYFDRQGKLFIWGMIDQAIHYQSFLNYESESGSEQPGLFQVSINDIGTLNVLFDYELLATLKQNKLIPRYLDVFTIGPVSKILKANAAHLKDELKTFLSASHAGEHFEDWEIFMDGIWIQVLSRLLLRIQNYHHGGAILITDEHEGIDIKYAVRYDRLKHAISNYAKETVNHYMAEMLIDEHLGAGKKVISKHGYLEESRALLAKQEIADEIKGCISFLASHTCVDGVLLFSRDMISQGFGGVLKTRRMPKRIFVSSAATASPKSLVAADPGHFGTRHRSMIAYCWNHPGSLGLVISQDGDIRAFHRIEEKLIMWENIKTQQFLKSNKLRRRN
ncbi:diadenylate cyclase [Mucilaginibacter gynuensis]|uniref:Diadenylate cyclase n=1 Tax=Mucilaginibacter gynuensis TaxID=1302236 RepID=A0ABP8GCW7_9SPHI